ncbi:MAG TPA: hypothetical protein ENN34_02530 [Deltaproteobacteria bacterium]|nr:hypothetical protein [Deltaproteobacteria bacterium]
MLEPGVGEIIRAMIAEGKVELPLRIQLHFSGCINPTLYLCADSIREADLIHEIDELTFVMDPETFRHVGEVTIACVDDRGKKGFVLSPSDPERRGNMFSMSTLKIRSTFSG